MKTILKNLSLMIAVLFFLCSCNEIWPNPISDAQDAKVDRRLLGTWVQKEKTGKPRYHIYAIDKHLMSLTVMNTMDDAGPACYQLYVEMHVSELEGRTFLNMRGYDCSTEKFTGYSIYEYEFNAENELFLYITSDEFIVEAIENNRLSGNIYKDKNHEEINITATSSEIREFIKNSPKEQLFRPAVIYERVEGPKETKKSICILF